MDLGLTGSRLGDYVDGQDVVRAYRAGGWADGDDQERLRFSQEIDAHGSDPRRDAFLDPNPVSKPPAEDLSSIGGPLGSRCTHCAPLVGGA